MTIGWLTAMLDSPPETAAASETFWGRVTGTRLSPRRETARHQDLGARAVRRTPHWTTLRDPAGRGYCLTRRDVEAGRLR
jgi:hypothetical protein